MTLRKESARLWSASGDIRRVLGAVVQRRTAGAPGGLGPGCRRHARALRHRLVCRPRGACPSARAPRVRTGRVPRSERRPGGAGVDGPVRGPGLPVRRAAVAPVPVRPDELPHLRRGSFDRPSRRLVLRHHAGFVDGRAATARREAAVAPRACALHLRLRCGGRPVHALPDDDEEHVGTGGPGTARHRRTGDRSGGDRGPGGGPGRADPSAHRGLRAPRRTAGYVQRLARPTCVHHRPGGARQDRAVRPPRPRSLGRAGSTAQRAAAAQDGVTIYLPPGRYAPVGPEHRQARRDGNAPGERTPLA